MQETNNLYVELRAMQMKFRYNTLQKNERQCLEKSKSDTQKHKKKKLQNFYYKYQKYQQLYQKGKMEDAFKQTSKPLDDHLKRLSKYQEKNNQAEKWGLYQQQQQNSKKSILEQRLEGGQQMLVIDDFQNTDNFNQLIRGIEYHYKNKLMKYQKMIAIKIRPNSQKSLQNCLKYLYYQDFYSFKNEKGWFQINFYGKQKEELKKQFESEEYYQSNRVLDLWKYRPHDAKQFVETIVEKANGKNWKIQLLFGEEMQNVWYQILDKLDEQDFEIEKKQFAPKKSFPRQGTLIFKVYQDFGECLLKMRK